MLNGHLPLVERSTWNVIRREYPMAKKNCILLFIVTATTCNLLTGPMALGTNPQGVNLASMDDWNIVVAPDAIESEMFAAQEFSELFAKASGIKLPIIRTPKGPDQHVYIGPGTAMARHPAGFRVDEFGPEDLRIIVRDDTIVIAGGRPRGTLYGVYSFLEDHVGVRFLTADHTYIPPLGRWHRIGPVDRFYHPPLDYRWVGYEANYASPAFSARLKLNAARVNASPVGATDGRGVGKYGGRTPMQFIGHSFGRQLPPAQYAKDHPEYYCLFRGKRYAKLKPGENGIDFKRGQFAYGMQPCLTHPDVKRIVTQKALDELSNQPDVLNVTVSQNDGGAHCQCPPCAAIDERQGTKAGALITFVNEVADEVHRQFPDRMVSTLAYSDTSHPPRTLQPRDNVQVMWCSIGACFIHALNDPMCPQNVGWNQQLRTWSSITKHLYAWNYYLNDEYDGYQRPLPNLRLIGQTIRYQVSLGVRGMFMQATSSSNGNEFEELRNYLLSNLLWDPSRDGRALINEWLALHYGPAAPPIARWINHLHEQSVASGKHCRCLGGTMADMGLDETDAQAGLDAFEEAMTLAGNNPEIQRRVEKASIAAYSAAIDPIWRLKDGQKPDAEVTQKMRPLAKRFFSLCAKHGVTRTGEGSHRKIGVFETRLMQALAP